MENNLTPAELRRLRAWLEKRSAWNNVLMQPKKIIELLDEVERYRSALVSIAKNSCCDGCREAGKVAYTALADEVGRYREALEFYADEQRYKEWNKGVFHTGEIQQDQGQRARAALQPDLMGEKDEV